MSAMYFRHPDMDRCIAFKNNVTRLQILPRLSFYDNGKSQQFFNLRQNRVISVVYEADDGGMGGGGNI